MKYKLSFIFYLLSFICICGFSTNAMAASVVATVDGTPITDTDITSRVKLMSLQGQHPTDNRRVALNNIIDDNIKLNYCSSMKIAPSDADVKKEVSGMKANGFDTSSLSSADMAQMNFAVRANIAWQMMIGRMIMPTIDIDDDDIRAERADLATDKGLPIELTLVHLFGVPTDVSAKLTKPKSCDDAMSMAKNLGGDPVQMTAMQYELSPNVRAITAKLGLLQWSPNTNGDMYLICKQKNGKDYEKLDDMIKQNAIYKRASFAADQQLKQLRRRAVIIVNDPNYKI